MLAERRADAETPRIARVPDEFAGDRLDKVLAKMFPEFSRSRLQAWIDAQRVQIDGTPAKIRQPVPLGATITLVPDLLPEQLAFTPEPVPLDIVYEDDALVVINKPAGMVVHPAAGNWSGTLLNGLLYRYGEAAAGLPRAGIVHRLDKETSGLMVVARTLEAQTRPHAPVAGAHGQAPLRRARVGHHAGRRHDRCARSAAIRATVRAWRWWKARRASPRARISGPSIARCGTASRCRAIHCDLETGRTHQIRVHCAHTRHPLLGDPVYGHARGKRSVTPLPNGFAASGAACVAARPDSSGVGQGRPLARGRSRGHRDARRGTGTRPRRGTGPRRR